MIVNLDTRRVVARRPRTALGLKMRFFGLMGKRFESLDYDALIFGGCSAIHTMFLRMPIDVIFLDKENTVVTLRPRLAPWRLCFGGRRAFWTVELPAGGIATGCCKIGHRLNMNMELTGEAAESLRGTQLLPDWDLGLLPDSVPEESL